MIYKFADLVLDLDRHLLTRKGEEVKLTSLSFKVLQALVQASPALLSHDELIDRVWGPDRIITLDNLSQRMKTLRQSLGDDPGNPSYIESVRGEGYRLVPEVRAQAPAPPSDQPQPGFTWPVRPSLVGMVLLVVFATMMFWQRVEQTDDSSGGSIESVHSTPTPGNPATQRTRQPAIAVLPFANLSANPENLFFTDGIHDDLLTRISSIKDIKTISRTSVMTYRGSTKKLGQIARELGVTSILEGGVQRSGDQVRINLQLIDAETDAHLWARTYTRELTATNVFVVQAEIVEAVAGALRAILSDEEKRQLEKLPTANLAALDAYFVGNHYFELETSEDFDRAIAAYQTAIELDPEFAVAYSRQAMVELEHIWFTGRPAETQLKKSKPLIDRAILLDPQSSTAFTALGSWYRRSGETGKAVQAFEQALALAPNSVTALENYGSLLQWEMHDPVSAIELYSRASELDPQNVGLKRQVANALPRVGRASDGIQMMESIVAEHPDSAAAYRDLAELYSSWEFRHDKGIRASRNAFELDPIHPPNAYRNAIMHWRLGDYDNTALWMNYIAGLVPDSEEARVYRGWALIGQGDVAEARKEFSSSNSLSVLYWLGIFYLGGVDTEEGRPGDAIERYRDYAAEFDGRKSLVNLYYGITAVKAYQALGEEDKAQALVTELISGIEASPLVTYHDSAIQEASLYALSGQAEVAIEILEEWASRGGATALLQQDIRHGLSTLADTPRFQAIFKTVNDRLTQQKANLKAWEASGDMLPIPDKVMNPD